MEALVLRSFVRLPADTGHHLGNQHQVNDQRRRQQRVLANVEQADRLVSTHEDLRIVLIQRTLVVANGRHVLDHNAVVGVLVLLVQKLVGRNHVVHHVRLGNLLGPELLVGAQVLAVVVAQVVVAGNRGELDTRVDQEVNQSRLHLGLTGLEVITTNEGLALLRQVQSTGNEGVLRRSVDEWDIVQNRRHSKDGRRGHLLVTGLDRLEQVLGRVIDTGHNVSVTLRVGSPHDNDLVQSVLSLEVAAHELANDRR